jgi:hypothetical protein
MSGGRPLVLVLLDNQHGPDRRMSYLAQLLGRDGYDVRVAAWDRRPSEDIAAEVPAPAFGEEVHRISVPAPVGGGSRSLVAVARFGARVFARRKELLRRVSAVIAADIYMLPLGVALARTARVPLIYDAREEYAALEADRYRPGMLRLAEAVETACARHARAIVVPGPSRLPRWAGVGPETVVLPNAGPTEERPTQDIPKRYDLTYGGLLTEQRRPDLVIELARRRPDLRIAVTGGGRLGSRIAEAAEQLPNLDWLGWVRDPDDVIRRSATVYYGQDPTSPYSSLACPNTVYQAVAARTPILFHCGGELARAAAEYRIGIRCPATVAALDNAVEAALSETEWEFDRAHAELQAGVADDFLATVRRMVPRSYKAAPGREKVPL